MRRTWLLAAVMVSATLPLHAESDTPTAKELLSAMDDNLQYETRTTTMTMKVIDKRRTREYVMKTFGRGQDEAAIEYVEPTREKGTRMLKKGDNLWLYLPRAERTQKISGHLLRQGMMGSDISYEDLMAGTDFEEMYEATVAGKDDCDGRVCWKVEAVAKDDSVTYPKRVFWVDAEWLIPVKQELYALSGVLLKTWEMGDVKKIGDRWVPTHMTLNDALREGSRTELVIEDIQFKVPLEDEVFTRRWLERK